MASYRYLREIAPEELQPEQPRQYTRRERAANWWHYHWKMAAAAALVCLGILLFWSDQAAHAPASDYTITVVGPEALPEGLCTALEEALALYAEDRNADGRTVLTVQSIKLDYQAAAALSESEAMEQVSAEVQLAADLEAGTSCLFLLAQPGQFQTATAALLYTDGTAPAPDEDTGAEWRRMVYRWADCPVLSQLALSGEEGAAWGEMLSGYYLGRRGIWTEQQAEALEGSEALWEALTQGAVPVLE